MIFFLTESHFLRFFFVVSVKELIHSLLSMLISSFLELRFVDDYDYELFWVPSIPLFILELVFGL